MVPVIGATGVTGNEVAKRLPMVDALTPPTRFEDVAAGPTRADRAA